ncbi:prolyl oligopeptidase family serine peptidase [Pontibacter sp. G13]|uniref:S9 family peptidase n=1 Tax=Pontibacter sp. G13 TaxID=3074898 RepID=UPI002889A7F9|nr:prolyl oligopeptidase family serine peptidase [Pontibacter sp. G13]WNJ19540.1 prolyl oligopeptidase family serine peptidase [Pontibacter sp. G13]
MNLRTLTLSLVGGWILGTSTPAFAQNNLMYQTPPKPIADLIDAPTTPWTSLSPDNQVMLLMDNPSLPSIEEVAAPELRLAGLRINPRAFDGSRNAYTTGFTLKQMDGTERKVTGLPEKANMRNIRWSSDGARVAFTHNTGKGLELWVIDVAQASAQKLTEAELNGSMAGTPYTWLSDNETIVYRSKLDDVGAAPEAPTTPEGPTISETGDRKAAVRTYQDLLKNRFDEELFTYYASGQLKKMKIGGTAEPIGEPGIIRGFADSPDGQYLLVTKVEQPFSYLVPYSRFPMTIEIWDMAGNVVKTVANVPSGETIPKGFMAVRTGPRSFSWRADKPATLYWAEAQDEGDPAIETDVRDALFHLEAPFTGEAVKDMDFELRYSGIEWGNDDLALTYQYWWSNRRIVTQKFSPADPAKGTEVIWDRSWEDRYNDPGDFETHENEYGRQVLLTDKKGKYLYLTGTGASPEGNRPFVDQYEIATGETERLWRSEAPYYESPVVIYDLKKMEVITRRESTDEPANYYIRNLKKDELTAITDFPHPYPQMKEVQKELIRYTRKDGVELTGTLYLPPGYDKERDGKLPVLMWAYPEEYKSKDAAGQVSGSPYTFIRINWASPLFWLMRGYAVLDDPGMPIVGEGDAEPNDSFREQLVANAEAAINKLDEMGVGDPARVAVGGHSYGAFMTANLLAHSDLFQCGIARSGAYNRTLTPFGFQSEERTYWEAPEVYYTMSPFSHADKINEPILLIHGEADNNSGTYPMQSERLFNALKGLGGDARLVMLPAESHGYRAYESVMHMLWEMTTFMDKHLGESSVQR